MAHDSGVFNIDVPSLAIYPSKVSPLPCYLSGLSNTRIQDSVADWAIVSKIVKSKSFVSQLEEVVRSSHHSCHPPSCLPSSFQPHTGHTWRSPRRSIPSSGTGSPGISLPVPPHLKKLQTNSELQPSKYSPFPYSHAESRRYQ